MGPVGLRPLQRSVQFLSADELTAKGSSFSDDLAAWRSPARTHAPLGHEVRTDSPAGLASGLTQAVQPVRTSASAEPLPLVQRSRSWPARARLRGVGGAARGPVRSSAPVATPVGVAAPATGRSTFAPVPAEPARSAAPAVPVVRPASEAATLVTASTPNHLPVLHLPAAPAALPVQTTPDEANSEPGSEPAPEAASPSGQAASTEAAPTVEVIRPVSLPPEAAPGSATPDPPPVQRHEAQAHGPHLPLAHGGAGRPPIRPRKLGLGEPLSHRPATRPVQGPVPGSPLATSVEAARAFLEGATPGGDVSTPATPAPAGADAASASTPPPGAEVQRSATSTPRGEAGEPPQPVRAPLLGDRPSTASERRPATPGADADTSTRRLSDTADTPPSAQALPLASPPTDRGPQPAPAIHQPAPAIQQPAPAIQRAAETPAEGVPPAIEDAPSGAAGVPPAAENPPLTREDAPPLAAEAVAPAVEDTPQAPLLGERAPLGSEPDSVPLSSTQVSPQQAAPETTADIGPPLVLPRPPLAGEQAPQAWIPTRAGAAPTSPVVQRAAQDAPTPPVVPRAAQDAPTPPVVPRAAQKAPPMSQRAPQGSPPATPAATPSTRPAPADAGDRTAPRRAAGPSLPLQRAATPLPETTSAGKAQAHTPAHAPTDTPADLPPPTAIAVATEIKAASPVTGEVPLVGGVPLVEPTGPFADHGPPSDKPDGPAPTALRTQFAPVQRHAEVPSPGESDPGGRASAAAGPRPAAARSAFLPMPLHRSAVSRSSPRAAAAPAWPPRPSVHPQLRRVVGTPSPLSGLAAGPTMPAAPVSAVAAPADGALPINGVALQRAPEAPPAPRTAPGPAAVNDATSAAGPRTDAPHAPAAEPEQQGTSIDDLDLDELSRRLADPLLRRIKRELCLDRDRTGHLTDFGR